MASSPGSLGSMPAAHSSASAAAWPAAPQLAHLTAERGEIGLRPFARARQRRSGYAAAARIRALLPVPRALGMQLLDGVFVGVDEPHETGGERLVFDIRAAPPAR